MFGWRMDSEFFDEPSEKLSTWQLKCSFESTGSFESFVGRKKNFFGELYSFVIYFILNFLEKLLEKKFKVEEEKWMQKWMLNQV